MSKCRTNDCASNDCCSPDDFGYSAAKYLNTAQSFTAECESGTGDPVTITITAGEYCSKTSQADADAQALAAATSQAQRELCCCEDCPECPPEAVATFGPLTHAVWDAGRSVIWGARGGVLAKFDAAGAFLDYRVIVDPPLGEGFLLYDPVNDFVWLTHQYDPSFNMFDSEDERGSPISAKGFYVINPTTMVLDHFQHTADPYHSDANGVGDSSIEDYILSSGVRRMTLDSNRVLWFTTWIDSSAEPGNTGFASFDIDTFAHNGANFDWYSSWSGAASCSPNSLAYDSDHDIIFGSNGYSIRFTKGSAAGGAANDDAEKGINDAFQDVTGIYGMAYCPVNSYVYMVTRKSTVYKFKFNSYPIPATFPVPAHTWGAFDLGIAGITPRNIVYAPFNQKLYIPSIGGNKVIEVDPATDTVTNVFTGFDAPLDIVVTDAHVFAVQLGVVGLRLVV